MCEDTRIYETDLAAYNNGKLHGVWIDATLDPEEIQDQINAMLAASPEPLAEEFAIHDYEEFGGYPISEYEGIKSVQEVAFFIEDQQALGAERLSVYGGDIEEANRVLEESFAGHFKSLAEFAQDLTEETTQIPENLSYYIDYERMGHDMEMSCDIFSIATGFHDIYVFWNH